MESQKSWLLVQLCPNPKATLRQVASILSASVSPPVKWTQCFLTFQGQGSFWDSDESPGH